MKSEATGLREDVALVADELLPRVYAELQSLARGKMAREQPGQTLQPTALVHEAWLRLGAGARFENRAHFFAAAAEAMRRILIERARRKLAARRGSGQERVDVDEIEIAAPTEKDDELLAVHEALDRLATHDARKAELVKLRYFAGRLQKPRKCSASPKPPPIATGNMRGRGCIRRSARIGREPLMNANGHSSALSRAQRALECADLSALCGRSGLVRVAGRAHPPAEHPAPGSKLPPAAKRQQVGALQSLRRNPF